MIISLEYIYYIAGIFLTLITVLTLKDKKNPKRITTALFWGLYALTFLFGKVIPPMYMGIIVILIAITAGFGGVGLGSYSQSTENERKDSAKKLGNLLFLPALLIPIVTIIGALWLKNVKIGGLLLLDKDNVTIVSLGVACLIALIVSLLLTKQKAMQSIKESRRLIDTIGWASILPQMLAALGGLFTVAGVGSAVTKLVSGAIPVDNKFLVVVAYVVAMALFTMIMGNAFAAFPVITGGIGLPLVVHMHGGNPAVLAAIGMFSGYCGTLMTPMAANYNIVPAALLDLPDKNDVIKVQVPTALLLLVVNIFLMYFLVY
jgi:Predicted membrane protein